MLLSLHVKNLALIEEEEVTFTDGLNILTGETGAGKSIIIGSVNLALGAKADKAIIRTGADYALIEMTFLADNETQIAKLKEMDLPIEEDGTILIKRKILPGRSACSVCGESVTLRQLREIAELLIDIYGQRENQKLLRREAQLLTVDEYAGEEAERLKASVAQRYKKWRALTSEWERTIWMMQPESGKSISFPMNFGRLKMQRSVTAKMRNWKIATAFWKTSERSVRQPGRQAIGPAAEKAARKKQSTARRANSLRSTAWIRRWTHWQISCRKWVIF
jgi:hypothetical protein